MAAAALPMLRLELDLPPLVEAAWWHESTNADPGHRWFRRFVREAASGLVALVPSENDQPNTKESTHGQARHPVLPAS
jgi:hypothetical protein